LKYFRNIGIVAIALFSFFYTEKIANLTLENNQVYKSIKESVDDYEVSYVNAEINGEYITPGLNGKKVALKDSYYNMKDLNVFNSYYLIFDTSYPEVSVDNNKDKIINRGNINKKSVSFILEYNEEVINYFKNNNIDASILVNMDTFNKEEKLEQLNGEVNEFKNLDTLISKYQTNDYCYLNKSNESYCRKNKKYLVKTDKIINNQTFIDIKNNITSGDIYYVEKNMDVDNLKILIKSILYKDLDIVRLSELLSEERK